MRPQLWLCAVNYSIVGDITLLTGKFFYSPENYSIVGQITA